jgi:energy-coupling factor transport system ATP-binding protein
MQYPEYQLFDETVREDIAFAPKNMGLSQDEISERVEEAARYTGLTEDILSKSPFDLSGGQKRRVALAGVIAMRPEVLVLDEPAAGLDPLGRRHIFNGIREYQRKTGSTVLIVSHSMEDMAKYSDDVIVMSNAKVLRHGSREEVFAHVEELSKTGLDIPQITQLCTVLRQSGMPIPEGIYTVEDATAALEALFGEGGAR